MMCMLSIRWKRRTHCLAWIHRILKQSMQSELQPFGRESLQTAIHCCCLRRSYSRDPDLATRPHQDRYFAHQGCVLRRLPGLVRMGARSGRDRLHLHS
jgi:hypothetical protein